MLLNVGGSFPGDNYDEVPVRESRRRGKTDLAPPQGVKTNRAAIGAKIKMTA